MRALTATPTEPWERQIGVVQQERTEEFGPYLVHEEQSGGGLATIHRAIERGRGATAIALKRLKPRFAADWELVNAFVQEAQLASRLYHARIAETYTYGRIAGTYYVTTELVRGPTLDQILVHSRSAAGAIPVPIAIELLIQLADALDYLHTRPVPIVHRGLVPSAIVVSTAGSVKLVDFAIARAVPAEAASDQLDPRGDLLALGRIAHELLTGRAPARRVSPASRWNPQVTHDLDDIVLTALASDPTLRWQNAAAMRFALKNVAATVGVVGAKQIRDWTAWAFSREPRQDSALISMMIDTLEHDFRASP